jgi:hypothetical protein
VAGGASISGLVGSTVIVLTAPSITTLKVPAVGVPLRFNPESGVLDARESMAWPSGLVEVAAVAVARLVTAIEYEPACAVGLAVAPRALVLDDVAALA